MPYDKIDSSDITLQLESSSVDVWVPDGIAIKRRSDFPQGFSLAAPNVAASSVSEEQVTYSSDSNQTVITLGGKSPVTPVYVDATVSGGKDTNARITNQFGRKIGAIAVQNRIPVPVYEDTLVTMAGSFGIRRTGMEAKDSKSQDTALLFRVDLIAIGYVEDDFGQETAVRYNLMSFTQNLQPIRGTGIQPGLVNVTLPPFDYSVIPPGCDRVFLSVSYVAANDFTYTGVDFTVADNSQYYTGGYFLFWPQGDLVVIGGIQNYFYLYKNNPLRIITKFREDDSPIVANSLSQTGAAFKNRPFFSNVYPLFEYQEVLNNSFANDLSNMITDQAVVVNGGAHTGLKCARINNSGILVSAEEFSVSPGDQRYFSAWLKNESFTGAGGIVVQQRVSGVWQTTYVGTYPAEINVWSKRECRIEALANADLIRCGVVFFGTGVIYIDDFEYAKLSHDNEIVLMGGSGNSTNVSIYEWTGASRGNLIKNISVPANQRVVSDISSITGTIEIAKANAPQTPISMGFYKDAPLGPLGRNGWWDVQGLVPNNLSYPGSTTPDSISAVMNFTGQIYVSAYATFGGAADTYNKGVRVLKNGVVPPGAEFTTKARTTGMSGRTQAISVMPGDQIRFQVLSDSEFADRRTLQPGVNKTHFEITVVPNSVSGNDFFVESVLAKQWDDFTQEQDRLNQVSYIDVVDELSSISMQRSEADAGVMTIKFCSLNLDPRTSAALLPGKRIRLLGRHYGEGKKIRPSNWVGPALYDVVMTAKIKRVEVTYDYKNEPQITVTCYDVYQKIDSTALNLAFDTMEEYFPALNCLGCSVNVSGIEVGGQSRPLPSELEFFPSTYKDMSLMDALIMTRNTNKSYFIVDRFNRLQLFDNLDTDVKMVFTDGTLPGQLSMGGVKQSIDTESIINQVAIEENLIDRDDLIKRTASSARPPEEFKQLSGKQRTIRFQDTNSVRLFGEYSKTFQVVRGSGSYEDIYADNFGTSFDNWATDILENFSQPQVLISEINVPVKDSDAIRMLSSIELLDKHWVCYLGETYEVNVRKITHDIRPGRWTTKINYYPQSDQTYW